MISISEYDPEVDAIYFQLKNEKVLESEEISKGIVVDYDDNDNIVGIELLGLQNITVGALKNLKSILCKDDMALLKEHILC
ncbi:DUF2283 domain-containing protein (plasmid) [Cyanobacterium sp. IPPAS B-1200]|uniref:DUF2283 domain-containing protein n=1 Tax=Cyanobacterium sp. IPPAS B-1200 TaxID=1562720 RepID=UPI0008525CF1|nr:DUF2283 domain-containing protein [Cyanobacterium sp. IPPAS B-1200]OEJ78117.1 hypothetical protein A5482_14170 [Cyanobacterium sp. IPPAS B-1200]